MTESPDSSPSPLNSSPKPRSSWIWYAISIAWLVLVGMVFFDSLTARESPHPTPSSQCKGNLKQIGLALHNYYDFHHALPPAYTVDSNGKPLHSWRTLLLPFMGQVPLYNSINLSKPWDDPANLKLFEQSNVAAYQCPSARTPKNFTTYLAIVGSDCCFQSTASRAFPAVTDGLENTLAIIDAAPEQAVKWMSPLDAYEELVLAIKPGSKRSHSSGTHALMVDGSIRILPGTIPPDKLRALLTIAGHETVGDW